MISLQQVYSKHRKTVLLQFCERNNFGKNQIIWFDNSEFTFTDVIKYLGVDMDSQLNFTFHISRIFRKLANSCGLLKHI